MTADDLNALSLAAARAGRNATDVFPTRSAMTADDLNALSLEAARAGRNLYRKGGTVAKAKGGVVAKAKGGMVRSRKKC
jgi:hypothetical protein